MNTLALCIGWAVMGGCGIFATLWFLVCVIGEQLAKHIRSMLWFPDFVVFMCHRKGASIAYLQHREEIIEDALADYERAMLAKEKEDQDD